MLYWWLINWSFGPGLWGFQPQISYQVKRIKMLTLPLGASRMDNDKGLYMTATRVKFIGFIGSQKGARITNENTKIQCKPYRPYLFLIQTFFTRDFAIQRNAQRRTSTQTILFLQEIF